MTLRIGLAVSSDAVRIVGVRDGAVLWAGESPIDNATPLEIAGSRLLGTVRIPRWPRAHVVVAVGPAQAQTKRLDALPPVRDAKLLARVVSESAGRFFLRNGIPLVTTGARVMGPGDAWVGALDEPVVGAVAALCRRHRVVLDAVVPSVVVVGRGLQGERIVWRDGDVVAEITTEQGALTGVRRVPMGLEREGAPPQVAEVLRALGEDAWRYADAYGAALAAGDEPLAIRPGRAQGDTIPPVARWRLAVAGSAVALALAAAALAPALAARRARREAVGTLAALAVARRVTVRDESNLRKVSGALDEVAAFEGRRRSPTLLLGAVVGALPESAILVALRADSAGGNLVLLAPRAGDMVTRLERVAGIAVPQIVGPVTRESVGGRELDRVTVRFHWPDTRITRRAGGAR